MKLLKDLIKEVGGDYAQLASKIEDAENYVDTGSYVLNALISGSIFGGISQKRIIAFAADESCGKTFIALNVVKEFLNTNEDGICLYFDTESAISKTLLLERGIDVNRVAIINVVTIEEFRSKALKAVDLYLKKPVEERKPLFIVLDSLGMLSTNKEINDALEEKDTRDMTKAQLVKGAFRMLTLKLGDAKIPMIVNNHLYGSMSMYSPKEMSGGCLTKDVKILTDEGYKNIDSIQIMDKVMTKEGVYKEVIDLYKFENKEVLEIEFEDGYKIKCTPEHKFFVNGEWIEARYLKVDSDVDVLPTF